jgi:hypothetical protein
MYLRATKIVALTLLTVLAVSGTAGAVDADISLDVPNTAEVGEQVSIQAETTAPDVPLVPDVDVTVEAFVDGEKIGSNTVSVTTGGTQTVGFSHTFSSTGTKTVKVTASSSEFTEVSASQDVQVDLATVQRSGVTVQSGIQSQSNQITEIEQAVNNAGLNVNVRDEAGTFYESDGTKWVVLANKPVRTGASTVTGVEVPPSSLPGLSYGIISASSVTTETFGNSVSVSDLRNNPDNYDNSLVRVKTEAGSIQPRIQRRCCIHAGV